MTPLFPLWMFSPTHTVGVKRRRNGQSPYLSPVIFPSAFRVEMPIRLEQLIEMSRQDLSLFFWKSSRCQRHPWAWWPLVGSNQICSFWTSVFEVCLPSRNRVFVLTVSLQPHHVLMERKDAVSLAWLWPIIYSKRLLCLQVMRLKCPQFFRQKEKYLNCTTAQQLEDWTVWIKLEGNYPAVFSWHWWSGWWYVSGGFRHPSESFVDVSTVSAVLLHWV